MSVGSLPTHCQLADKTIAPSDYGISVAGGLSHTLLHRDRSVCVRWFRVAKTCSIRSIYQFLVRSFDTDDSQDLRRPHGTFSLADNQSAKVGVNTKQNVPLGERTSFWFPPLLVLPPFPCGMERLGTKRDGLLVTRRCNHGQWQRLAGRRPSAIRASARKSASSFLPTHKDQF